MLDDRQIDELENLIVFSTMDQLPLVLSRAIPILFAELRLVRATLDSKVNDFLGGLPHDLSTAANNEGTDRASQTGVPERRQPVGSDDPLPAPSQQGQGSGVGGGSSASEGGSGEGKVKRRGGRPKGSRNKKNLDAGDSSQTVRREVREEALGDSGILPIENITGHEREGRLN